MKSHLELHKIEHGTEEWYDFRKQGIGGSEVTASIGVDKDYSKLRLFHEKVGDADPRKDDNEDMYWGRTLEPIISDNWQYYDNSEDGYIENKKNKKIVRRCRQVNGYIVNKKYPWLFASIDRLINIDGGFNLITGEALQSEAILECKNSSYWASQAWDDGIPDKFLYQVTQYMLIMETDYAEIAMLKGGNRFYVEKVMFDSELAEKMIRITKDFWYNKVIPARKAFENRQEYEMTGDIMNIEKCESIIYELEPEADYTDDYTNFKNDRFMKEREKVIGTISLMNLAKKDNSLKALSNRIKDERKLIKNKCVDFMVENSSDTIDYGSLGTMTWYSKKGAKNRTFLNNYKEKPTKERIESEFNKLDLKY